MDIITYPGPNLIEIGATPRCLSLYWLCDLLTELLNVILAVLMRKIPHLNYYIPGTVTNMD